MKTAIVYTTQHGTTAKVAAMINELAAGKAELIDLKKVKRPDLSDYDRIIVGGSIHAGQVQKRIRKFCETYQSELSVKPLGLFLSCMEENEKAKVQLEAAFPEALRNHAVSTKLTGGELLFENMNFIEKYMIKKIGKMTESVSKIKHDQIKELAQEMGLC
jgi:menaquinone-dependent protoporphyrinogen oxidase